MAVNAGAFNYLMLSDVHLGSDLVQHAAPWTQAHLQYARAVDEQLISMLDHYRREADPQRPFKLILAGDFLDLVGMSVTPTGATVATAPTAEELRHGLGNASDQSACKMRMVVARHREVFAALGAFVRAGHYLVMVRGNHDVELFWRSAQEVFRGALLDPLVMSAVEREQVQSRICFHDWFYYEEGVLYVEHGHQYDETCAHRHQLSPLCPRDGSRLSYSFSDILLRYIVRPTRGLSSDGHENRKVLYYVQLAASLGVRECARLAARFVRALSGMLHAWRHQTRSAVERIDALQEQRLLQLARASGIGVDRLRALQALAATPVTARFAAIARSVFIDRIAALCGASLMLLWLWKAQWLSNYGVMGVGLSAAWPLAHRLQQAKVLDPDACLREQAQAVAQILPTPYVVMGHTHQPRFERLPSTCYVNLGWWAGDDSEAPVFDAPPCSHLVLRFQGGRYRAALLSWNSRHGVRPFGPEHGPESAPSRGERPPRGEAVGRPLGALG